MATVKYEGQVVNTAVESIQTLTTEFDTLGESIEGILGKLQGKKGFDKLCAPASDILISFSLIGASIETFIDKIRNWQIKIISYNGTEEDAVALLQSLGIDIIKYDLRTFSRLPSLEYIDREKEALEGIMLVGIIESMANLVETGADLTMIALSCFESVFSWIDDTLNNTNSTEELWNETSAVTSNNYVESLFDYFYENTTLGKYLKENTNYSNFARAAGNASGEALGAIMAAEAATSGAINASTIQKVFKALFTFTSSTTDA